MLDFIFGCWRVNIYTGVFSHCMDDDENDDDCVEY